jgi:hypothetical protein
MRGVEGEWAEGKNLVLNQGGMTPCGWQISTRASVQMHSTIIALPTRFPAAADKRLASCRDGALQEAEAAQFHH